MQTFADLRSQPLQFSATAERHGEGNLLAQIPCLIGGGVGFEQTFYGICCFQPQALVNPLNPFPTVAIFGSLQLPFCSCACLVACHVGAAAGAGVAAGAGGAGVAVAPVAYPC